MLQWVKELEFLRQIILGLTEEIKWSVSVYTNNGKNVVTVNALKESANIDFFKRVLLADQQKIIRQQGNLQSDRIVKFIYTEEIKRLKEILKEYVLEAIAIEKKARR